MGFLRGFGFFKRCFGLLFLFTQSDSPLSALVKRKTPASIPHLKDTRISF